jgi:hypothetical protein
MAAAKRSAVFEITLLYHYVVHTRGMKHTPQRMNQAELKDTRILRMSRFRMSGLIYAYSGGTLNFFYCVVRSDYFWLLALCLLQQLGCSYVWGTLLYTLKSANLDVVYIVQIADTSILPRSSFARPCRAVSCSETRFSISWWIVKSLVWIHLAIYIRGLPRPNRIRVGKLKISARRGLEWLPYHLWGA